MCIIKKNYSICSIFKQQLIVVVFFIALFLTAYNAKAFMDPVEKPKTAIIGINGSYNLPQTKEIIIKDTSFGFKSFFCGCKKDTIIKTKSYSLGLSYIYSLNFNDFGSAINLNLDYNYFGYDVHYKSSFNDTSGSYKATYIINDIGKTSISMISLDVMYSLVTPINIYINAGFSFDYIIANNYKLQEIINWNDPYSNKDTAFYNTYNYWKVIEFNKFQTALKFELGWNYNIGNIVISPNVSYNYFITNVIDDRLNNGDKWKLNNFSAGLKVYYKFEL